MARVANNTLLHVAKSNKKDEFYTQLKDIEKELKYYKHHFHGKTVFCNCDDARHSNFFNYFVSNFEELGLKKLICACYRENEMSLFNSNFEPGYYYEYTGKEKKNPDLSDVSYFNGDGDFRSQESIELLKQSDIIVTNPPFSLFREFVDLITSFDKQFLIIGNINIITYIKSGSI